MDFKKKNQGVPAFLGLIFWKRHRCENRLHSAIGCYEGRTWGPVGDERRSSPAPGSGKVSQRKSHLSPSPRKLWEVEVTGEDR